MKKPILLSLNSVILKKKPPFLGSFHYSMDLVRDNPTYIFLEILLKFGKNVPVLGNFYESMDLVVKTPCQVLNVHQKDYNWLKLCG